MSNIDHLRIIQRGWESWNAWRVENPTSTPNLRGANLTSTDLREVNLIDADLSHADLSGVDLSGGAILDRANLAGANMSKVNLYGASIVEANLSGATLNEANLGEAILICANLSDVDLDRANLSGASLHGAQLDGASLVDANLSGASLDDASLCEADLVHVDLTEAGLTQTDLSLAQIGGTIFGDNDLSTVKGLHLVQHLGPSTIGVDTLYRSNGQIPEAFLRGAGIPEEFITYLPSLVGGAIEFYSCFISYSHNDDEFAKHLHSRMRKAHLRVWFAPEDIKGGKKLHEQIFRAIQLHDRLLVVLSESSMNSEWVTTEIRRAMKVGREENRRKLFPIRLVDWEAIQKWECFDADSGKDLAIELREYYIPDFSNWKDHDDFEVEFGKLLRDLKTEQLDRRVASNE